MQEIKKRRIVIASVLKPVDDTRMFSKIGCGLATWHEVHVLGHEGEKSDAQNTKQHSLGRYSRLSLRRFAAYWKFMRIVAVLNPDLVIICTHELILPAMVLKALRGFRLWYDVQENYAMNLRHTSTFPAVIKDLLAAWVRLKERFVHPFVERYLLAEASYLEEMPYLASRALVLENKVRREEVAACAATSGERDRKQFIFSGTLSESTGVYTAIDVARALHKLDAEVRLLIIGFCPKSQDHERLSEIVSHSTFIQLVGGSSMVRHAEIMAAIGRSGVGLICYPENPSTWSSTPTKLYEYLACRLPILAVNNARWKKIIDDHQAGVCFNPLSFTPSEVYEELMEGDFYSFDYQDVFWDFEDSALLSLV